MRISDETIDYVGILAKLDLNDQEKEQAKTDMSNMLDYIDKLNELDTDAVEAMSHVSPIYNVFREDIVQERTLEDREKILHNAPKQKDGCFVVPKTVE
jgi:aspartyl-tRNA(Asn)/glutamyl-tRNA(Gln) amidotransferase subunit C